MQVPKDTNATLEIMSAKCASVLRFVVVASSYVHAEKGRRSYSSTKIRKTQNEHLIIDCQNCINLKPISYFFGVYTACFLLSRIYLKS